MHTILIVTHLFLALGVIGLVLMQHGKGADAGAAFGAGASGTVFGAAGSANFLSRATALLAALFFLTSLSLAWFAMQSTDRPGLMIEETAVERIAPEPVSGIPVVPGQESGTGGSGAEVPQVPETEKTGQ